MSVCTFTVGASVFVRECGVIGACMHANACVSLHTCCLSAFGDVPVLRRPSLRSRVRLECRPLREGEGGKGHSFESSIMGGGVHIVSNVLGLSGPACALSSPAHIVLEGEVRSQHIILNV